MTTPNTAPVTRVAGLTGAGNYFEDFRVGLVIRHARGKTLEALENVFITNLVMNTAAGHFDEHVMKGTPFGQRLSFGGVNFSLVLGLASQDTTENAIVELGLDKIRLTAPVFHGDTLYAYSEVLEAKDADRPDAGEVRFKHWGVNQDGKVVCEVERRALIKRRSHWVPAP
ncbi:MaoC family dehydratase [Zavarzinia sp. CC-PAN008]|uniref:MaoC family dehydratase n=1 Tax=Zavarzinia sp. CC-PAN008 TaxID=3243332 RepID=UPI003F743C69